MAIANMFSNILRTTNRIYNVRTKLQGGRLQKIGTYFQNIFSDYRAVAQETVSDIQSHPIKAAFYITSFGVTGYLIKTNPSEESFFQCVTENVDKLVTVGDPIRNPHSDAHIENLVRCINHGILRRTTLGICSFMWVDNFDRDVDLFEARCSHLNVSWSEWKTRIIDFGMLGSWWCLEKAMQDYDINPDEWKDVKTV